MRLNKHQKKGLFRGAIIALITIAIIVLTGFIFCIRTPESYYNVKGMYNAEDLDVLFIGNSHGIAAFNVPVFEEVTGLDAYNVSTTNQTAMSGALLVEEALNTHDIDTVIIESFSMIYPQPSDFYYSKMLTSDTTVFRSLNNPKLKVRGMINQIGMRRKFDAILPLFKDHANWKTPVNWHLWYWNTALQADERTEYQAEHVDGYRIIPYVMREEQYDAYLEYHFNFDLSVMNQSKAYWEPIINLCHEKGVNVIFVTVPWLDRFIANTNYDDISAAYQTYFDSKDVIYLDMNQIDLGLEYTHYSSEDPGMNQHLNETGAQITTHYLADWYNAHFK